MTAPMLTDISTSPITPRRLILDLFDAEAEAIGYSARIINAGEVFGFNANQMRVALSRLVADGLLECPSRGRYRLAPSADTLYREIQHWRELEETLIPWKDNWSAICTDNLAREGSTAYRTQTRALELRGLKRWKPGIWVRPDNLSGGTAVLVDALTQLGLDAMTGSFIIDSADSQCRAELIALWPLASIEADYARLAAQLETAIVAMGQGSTRSNLIQTICLGSRVITQLLKDPLLPSPLINGDKRRQLIDLMKHYDSLGRALWRRYLEEL